MLTTIAVVLIILWLLGVVGTYSIGWFIHVLLVAAVILFLVRIIQGKNPVQ
ncbi:MAG TPA: lmo0937 family membrane protein [Candidatus Paceibacterota bacterium]|nr:lmo0937 family membrane protein [Candidatus Paceibacterota bacterium]